MRRYPAVLIGRLGVNCDLKNNHIGTEMMDFIKSWFIDPLNKTGCRFIVVDAYKDEDCMSYYLKNGFNYLFSSDEQEALNIYNDENKTLETRFMYFDLIQFVRLQNPLSN